MDISELGHSNVLDSARADVGEIRERRRRRRMQLLLAVLAVMQTYIVVRLVSGNPVQIGLPGMPAWFGDYLPSILLLTVLLLVLVGPMLGAGRSPHVVYRSSELDVALDDVVGIDSVKEEVTRSLNMFLGFRTFADVMGGTPRRGLLFEGPPGTGKTYVAKAMAREAGVPFLYVSASSFQSMYYGQTNRKIRSFFKALNRYAEREGGAIGFIDEFDAIGMARGGMRTAAASPAVAAASERATDVLRSNATEGISGVVNEILVQMQSFEQPKRLPAALIDSVNNWLPPHRQIRKPVPKRRNFLLIAATNRADQLDPALTRPGRFDRSIHFDLPGHSGRRAIIDFYLDRKSHAAELDDTGRRDALASMTAGYAPVMIQHVLDEALVWALRNGRTEMTWSDVQQAKMTEEIGLAQPVEYAEHERRVIATHEAGHAVVAYLAGKGRKLEVLSIVKRRGALGLLAHSDVEERFTMSRSELLSRIQIAFGGLVAEELFFGEHGTGPSSDLAFATKLAASMVGAYGMTGSYLSLDAVETGGLVHKVFADEQSRAAASEILDGAKEDVELLLEANVHLVQALRDALLERHELVGDDILDVLRDAEVTLDLADLSVEDITTAAGPAPRGAVDDGDAGRGADDDAVGDDAGRESDGDWRS